MKKWIMPGAIVIFAVVILALIVIRPDTINDDEVKPDSFGADLAFNFTCKGRANPPSKQAIEQFMTAKGFQILDKVAAGKKLDPDFSWMRMDIVAMDSSHRQITFKAFADQPDDYSVSLYSEPPTQHSKDLEAALLEFPETKLDCKVGQIKHVNNPAGAKDLYDHGFTTTENWFKEAAGQPVPASSTAPAPSTK